MQTPLIAGQSSAAKSDLNHIAQQLEGLFLQMLIKSMREAGEPLKSDLFSDQSSVLQDAVMDQYLSEHIAQNSSLGLSETLLKQWGPPEQPKTAPHSPPVYTAKASTAHPSPSAEPSPTLEGSLFNSPLEFVQSVWPQAKTVAADYNLDPKLLVAQAALETGWGKNMIKTPEGQSSYNLFGIKANSSWSGKKVFQKTLEYEDGIPYQKKEYFRSYSSIEESLRDYAKLMQNARYAETRNISDQPEQYMQHLQKSGYATDPHYAKKVLDIYHGERLNHIHGIVSL